MRFPVLFADATDCSRLAYWGLITAIDLDGDTTRYTVDRARPLSGTHTPQELVKRSTGEHIAANYIRPYAVCRTPAFVTGLDAEAANSIEFQLPEEIPYRPAYSEGSVCRIEVNPYERDPKARSDCIKFHGSSCCICGFNFGAVYGPEAEGYIHVHHIRPLSEIGGEYVVDAVADLRPVCPNCHAVLHLHGACRMIDDVRQVLARKGRTESLL
jgi:5-methylcytosine-specific restriction endonuclease McrA